MSGCQFYKIGMSKKPGFIKNNSAKMARLCPNQIQRFIHVMVGAN